MKQRAFCGFAIFLFSVTGAYSQNNSYNPLYWVEGTTHYDREATGKHIDSISAMIDDVSSKGWNGIMYWGASRDGGKMKYYFKSPFLEKQPWATFEHDALIKPLN
ncbi:MAG TPA: hypothetical protein VM101_10290 [Flavitalea sp.]|nr:hypothetical protein [Flavitalea sp.]